MKSQYTPSNLSRSTYAPLAIGLVGTALLFSLLPILQIIPNPFLKLRETNIAEFAYDHPPVIIELPKPEPPKREKLKKPEIERPKPRFEIHQLPILFNLNGDGDYAINTSYDHYIDPTKEAEIFDWDDLDKAPRAVFQVEPLYPYELRQSKVKGWVLIEWVISDDGSVRTTKVIESSNHAFHRPAIDSVLKSKWAPGEIAGKAVSTRVRQRITFNP